MKIQNSKVQTRIKSNQGFSLMEVLVSILMISGFLATAMQALISATAIKVRSEEISEATNWMQEDLEALKFEANRLDFDPSIGPDRNGDGLPDGDYQEQAAQCNSYAQVLLNRITAPRQPSLPTGTLVSPRPPYADDIQDRASSSGNRAYRLERTLTPNGNMLEVEYSVVRDPNPGGRTIGELYAEIIPDVAFYCEQG